MCLSEKCHDGRLLKSTKSLPRCLTVQLQLVSYWPDTDHFFVCTTFACDEYVCTISLTLTLTLTHALPLPLPAPFTSTLTRTLYRYSVKYGILSLWPDPYTARHPVIHVCATYINFFSLTWVMGHENYDYNRILVMSYPTAVQLLFLHDVRYAQLFLSVDVCSRYIDTACQLG